MRILVVPSTKLHFSNRWLVGIVVVLISWLCQLSASAQVSTVYFLAVGPKITQPQGNRTAAVYESYIVPVTDANAIAQIRSLIQQVKYPVVNVQIKAGNDGTNRDFYTSGAPIWNWQVSGLISVQGEPYLPLLGPPYAEELYGSATMIAANPAGWIGKHGNTVALQWFPLVTEVDPTKTPTPPDPSVSVMSNLSTRGFTGNGQDILIGGTTITGNYPKQIAVRVFLRYPSWPLWR
jgi:hypothetical protein